jgi:hypothetical protein
VSSIQGNSPVLAPLAPLLPSKDAPSADWKGNVALPSEIVTTRAQIIAKIWACFKFILNLFLWITGLRLVSLLLSPGENWIRNNIHKKFELALYEDIVLTSNHRHLMGAKTSVVLDYLHDFLKREKGISPEILPSLKQAIEWSQTLETAEDSWLHDKKQHRIGALANEIATKIQNLKTGESAIVPGGLHQNYNPVSPKQYALYRITKEAAGTFRLELWSRDSIVLGEAEATVNGKKKTLSHIEFQSLSSEEIANAPLWHALLSIHLPQSNDDADTYNNFPRLTEAGLRLTGPVGKFVKNFESLSFSEGDKPSPLSKLLAPFADRQVPIPEKVEAQSGYHAERKLCRVQNLWSLIHEQSEEGTQTIARRKLRLSLETLFRYFEATKDSLSDFALHSAYLQEGIRTIGLTALSLREKGHLSLEDEVSISRELKVIGDWVVKTKQKCKLSTRLSWFNTSSKVLLNKQRIQKMLSDPKTSKDLPFLQQEVPPSQEPSLRARASFENSQEIDLAKIDASVKLASYSFSEATFSIDLNALVQEVKQGNGSPIEKLHKIIDAAEKLPPFLKEVNGVKQEIPDNRWQKMPAEDRLAALEDLTDLAEQLVNLATTSQTLLPDRFLALGRIFMHSEYIARVDPENSKMTWQYICQEDTGLFGTRISALPNSKNFRKRSENAGTEFAELSFFQNWKELKEEAWTHANPWDYANPRTWRSDINNPNSGELNKLPKSRHIELLQKQGKLTRQMNDVGERFNRWGMAIDHPLMKATTAHNMDYPQTSQEAIVDHPGRVLKWFRRLSGDGGSSKAAANKPLPLSIEEQKELLLHLDTGLWGILGLVKKSPEILTHPDCRALLEFFFTDYGRVRKTVGTDPQLAAFLPEFLREHADLFWKKEQPVEALFLIRLAHTLKFNHPEFERLDFELFLEEKAAQSFTSEPLAQHRREIIAEYLWLLQHKKTLSAKEAKDFICLGFFLKNSCPNPDFFDPMVEDEMQRALIQKTRFLFDQIQKEAPALLDEICQKQKIPLPQEAWTGDFPKFKAGPIEIDLLEGTINDTSLFAALPPEIIRLPTFRKFFPILNRAILPKAKLFSFKEGSAYGFLDAQGTEWRIELQNGKEPLFYKKEQGQWLQYVTPDVFQAYADVSPLLPAYILEQTFFAPSGNSSELISYDASGKRQFKLQLHSPIRGMHFNVTVDDLRETGSNKTGMTLSPLSWTSPLFLHPFLGFDEGKDILVWSKRGSFQQVELPKHNLRFEIKNKQLVCTAPPFEGYQLEQNPSQTITLPSYLLLNPPAGSGKPRKLLIPRFGGSYFDLLPSPLLTFLPKMGFVQKWLLSKALPMSGQIPKYYWKAEEGPDKNFWAIDFKEGENPWDHKIEADVLFDLMKYAVHHSQRDPVAATLFIKQLIDNFKNIDPKSIDEKALLETANAIVPLAGPMNPFLVSETYPETAALILRLLLSLKEKATESGQDALIALIMGIATSGYFNLGKHIDRNSRLSEEETAEVLRLIRLKNPGYQPKQEEPLQIKKKLFPLRKISGVQIQSSKFARPVISALGGNERDPGTALFSRNTGKLRKTFPQIYKALKAPSSSLEFQRMRLTFKSLPIDSSPFIDAMEMLFDLKQENPNLSLPEMPDPKPLHVGEIRNDKARAQAYAKQKVAEGEFEAFFQKLDPLFPAPAPAQQPQIQPPAPSLLEQAIPAPIPQVARETAIETLESRLAERVKPKTAPTIAKTQPAESLFSAEQLEPLFPKIAPRIPARPDLRGPEKETPSNVLIETHRLEKELDQYENLLKEQQVRSVKDIGPIKKLLDAKVNACSQEVVRAQQEVDRLLARSRASFSQVEILAGAQPHVDWSDLKIAFLQKELGLVVKKMRNVSEADLLQSLKAYFQAKTLPQHAEYAKGEILAAEKEQLLESEATVQKLYRILTRQRSYESDVYPELLTLEEALGFLMDEEQLKMVQTLLDNPHAIARAVTGAGKTSVISVLLGLMKADGTNLVTLRFLDPLFAENARHFEKTLGQIMKKKVLLFQFSTKTPIVKQVGGEKVSLFKTMYEDFLRTIVDKGCVITNRRSLPLLESKYLSILYKASRAECEPIEAEHLFYLSKILTLLRERQECIYDEDDKALYPRDELHLALGETSRPPAFAIDTIRKFFNLATEDSDLKLRENIQGELSDEKRREILDRLAIAVGKEWEQRGFKGAADYFLGKSDQVLREKGLSLTDKDSLALTKDLFITYLPITLSHTAHQKYILSEDGVSVIPCEYTDVPREGSQFDNINERLVYATQYYYQKGVSFSWLKKWVQTQIKQGLAEMEHDKSIRSIQDTKTQAYFATYFPNRALPLAISDSELEEMRAEVANDPKKISSFLALILPEISIQKKKVSIDAQNQVSMSKASSGISATEGCMKGLHRQFTLPIPLKDDEPSQKGQERAQMVMQLLGRVNGSELLPYKAARPEEILPELLKKKQKMAIVIDGAGALLGVSPEQAAKQIQGNLEAVSYFNQEGQLTFLGDPKAAAEKRGHVFSNAQSRGADVKKLSPSQPAVLITNGRNSLEVGLQNVGRLRHPNHDLTIAVSEESGIKTLSELMRKWITVQAEDNSDNLYRSELQKMRDVLRSEMLKKLLPLTQNPDSVEEALDLFRKFQGKSDFLVSEKTEDWEEPGSYFRVHQGIQTKNKKPADALREQKEQYLKLAEELGLGSKWLTDYDPEALASEMPSFVWNNAHLAMGQQSQVETEQQTQVEQQMQQTEELVDLEEEAPFYLPWVEHSYAKFKIHNAQARLHPAYDPGLVFSENHLPLHRATWADPADHRTPHDRRQNRLRYVALGDKTQQDRSGFHFFATELHGYKEEESRWTLSAIDIRDTKKLQRDYNVVYDTYLRRFMTTDPKQSKLILQLERSPQFLRLLAQHKFEDGQIRRSDYSDEEWAALTLWLREIKKQNARDTLKKHLGKTYTDEKWAMHKEWLPEICEDPVSLRDYMEKDILKNRPQDQQFFPFSDVAKLLDTM